MNQRAAFLATVQLADSLESSMQEPIDPSLSLKHMRSMLSRLSADFSEAKLGRWLGWAQAALVAADVGVTLDDVRQINTRYADDPSTELKGATSVPETGLRIINAGEFAAMWNGQTPAQRQQLLDGLLDAMGRSTRCVMQDHDGMREENDRHMENYWGMLTLSRITAAEADRAIRRHGWVIEP
jgi:hypothetical protein